MKNPETTSSRINSTLIQRLLIVLTIVFAFSVNTLNAQVINNKTKKQLEKQQKEKLFGGNKPLTLPDGRSLQVEPLTEESSRQMKEKTKDEMERMNTGSDTLLEDLQSKMQKRAKAKVIANDLIKEINKSTDTVIRNMQ